MKSFTRIVLYAFVGMCVATAHVDLLAGLACWLLIELVFRQQETIGAVPPRTVVPQRPVVDTRHQTAKLADLGREAAKRAQQQAETMAKMRES